MAFFVSVGSVGTSRLNKYATGARGYEIVRKGNLVICRWAGVFVLGPTAYFWRRTPAVKAHRRSSLRQAKEFYRERVKRLKYSSEAYAPLGRGVRIREHGKIARLISELRARLRSR